ncbi:DNA translocase FtsK [Bacillus toyonensis]|uniref:Cell division protein FtsK n=1 Tax=Bacillus toyonensis TaxID=155322 RepID=A0A2A8HJL4_9BACI|nr:DNA translocase FtsK [Bacillus toyonensis]PEQ09269.1 cell division protein FtsK [Bacillus toyonensis]
MLDWMKKLFNKEEEQTAMNKEAMKQIESQPKIPRVNHYTEAREAQMASRNAGKCRFPLIPDDGFDEDDVRELPHFEEQPVQRGIYEEQPTQRGIKVERSRRQYVENAVSTYEEPEVQYEPDPEPVVKKISLSPQESSRRPFRPTEMISPIYGYNRPSVEKKEEKQEEEKEREDLEISVEGKSVVDAWLEKKGYTLSYFSEGKAPTSSSHQDVDQQGQQSKKEEKSVVDQWLEKNGYEIERPEPVVEEKEVIQEINTPQEVSADELLHKTVAERMEDAEQEKDVVVLNENILQEELVDSKVEHEDTILSEEIKRNTEIEQPIMEVEKQAPEESVIVKAEEKLEETIIVEIPEEFGAVAEVMAEAEETEEAEVMAEMEETEEAEVIAETEGSEVEAIVELEETQQEMVLDEAIEQKNEFIHVAEADEQTKEDVQSFANVLIAETEESKLFVEEGPVAKEQPIVQKEEPKREKKRHVPFNVVMLKQDRTRLMERHAARTSAMQSSMSERVENKPVHQLEEQPTQQMVVEPRVEEQPTQQMVVEPRVEEQPVQQVVVEPQVEEKPMQQVVVEPQVEEKPMQQVVVEPQVEEKPMQQVVVEPQVEEQPAQQMVVESRMEEQPVQQMVVESRVEERPVQQMVAGQVQKPSSSTEPQEKAYVVNQRENDMRNVLQTPPTYTVPPLALLSIPQQSALDNTEWLEEQKELLDTTFNNFHVGAHVINVSQGPAVTRFEVQPDPGVKVNKITNLSDDIKLSLAAKDIRIEAPIPGKSAIGIEVPNKESKPVFLREILRSPVFTKSESPLTVALGLDISGDPIVTDIRKMPHGLIAGATGSGKSVCINAILTSILYKAKPHEVKLILIDPKMVELAPYNSVPHLVAPVITDVKAATAALKWAVEEMERRYELFAHAGARDLTRYNTIVSEREIPGETLPYIVIVIDELADLMMVAPGDVEEAICRIAQKARACGIHLLVATQRPSVDVITGLIKSNIPTRIAFTVSSQVDSRTIIDIGGAEKLLGRGDMLFLGNGTSKPVRVQGVYVSDDEIEKTVDHVKKQMKPNYLFKQEDLLAKSEQSESEDELFLDACQFVVEQGGASTSSVQRKFRIGYNRAARLIEEMESQGIISEGRGTKPRDVLISEDEFAAMQETNI